MNFRQAGNAANVKSQDTTPLLLLDWFRVNQLDREMKSSDLQFSKPGPRVEKRVERLLARLTLDEKIHLLGGEHRATRGVPEKRIPSFRFSDGPMGVHWWCERATAYPATIGLTATWDPDLCYKTGRAVGRDARGRGVHVLLGPGVNLYRSPLCGRNFEYMGEDPELAATMASSFVRGVQSQGVAATVKHYAVNNQEYDRHQISSDVDERTLRECYLPAFERVVREAGVGAVMTAYNLVNGRHCSENDHLIRDILKNEWGFDGIVMSDWVSTYSAIGAVQAGLDLEMPTGAFMNAEKIKPALANGTITIEMINDKVRRLLRLAVCFGWFDRQQQDQSIPETDPVTMAVALDVARKGIVLLKNDDGLLPLNPGRMKKIVVLGEQAEKPAISGGGSGYTPPTRVVSILDALREKAEVTYFPAVRTPDYDHFAATCSFFTESGKPGLDVAYFSNKQLSGIPALQKVESRFDYRWTDVGTPFPPEVSRDHFSVRWKGVIRPLRSGTHHIFFNSIDGAVRCWLDGRLVVDGTGKTGGLFQVQTNWKAGKDVSLVADYTQMRVFGWCHLLAGWFHEDDVRMDYAAALQAARKADAVVVCAGFNKFTECEGSDRTFALDAISDTMIADAVAANPNTAVVLHTGGGIDMERWADAARAIIFAWYPGQEGGRATAEILFGDTNPSGKLPITIERKAEDRSSYSCYHDHDGDGRVQLRDGIFCGYRHAERHGIAPRFAFGHGLTYSSFAYGKLKIIPSRAKISFFAKVSFELANTSARAGEEVVQLYIGDPKSRLPRPRKELKDFARVALKPGQKKIVTFSLSSKHLRYFDPDRGGWVVEPGRFDVAIGASSADIRLKGSFNLK